MHGPLGADVPSRVLWDAVTAVTVGTWLWSVPFVLLVTGAKRAEGLRRVRLYRWIGVGTLFASALAVGSIALLLPFEALFAVPSLIGPVLLWRAAKLRRAQLSAELRKAG
jgi:hypothetical protein